MHPCTYTWYGSHFCASSVVIEERQKEFTNKVKKVAIRRAMFLSVNYPKNKGAPELVTFRLTDKVLTNWKIIDDKCEVEFESSQITF